MNAAAMNGDPTNSTDSTFPYRLACVDLDGTLLGPDKRVSPENLRAVRALQERGVRFTVASGRRYQNSLRFYNELRLDGPIIACQGALVIDPQTDEVLTEHPVPAPLAAELVTLGQRSGFSIIYYHRHRLLAAERNRWVKLYEERIGEQTETVPDLESLHGAETLKIVWYGEPAALNAMRPKLEAQYRGRLTILSTEAENLEFMVSGIDKGTALDAVAAHYGIGREATMAFGDGENDAPMLRRAGLGVAVDNANRIAKEAAALVGPSGAPETSFARAVEAAFSKVEGARRKAEEEKVEG